MIFRAHFPPIKVNVQLMISRFFSIMKKNEGHEKMFRYTERSHWPDGRWIVPLVKCCDQNGRVPDDGQYVPQAVLDKLAYYENLEELGEVKYDSENEASECSR